MSSPEYAIETIRTLERAREIRDIWQQMNRHPNADFDFYCTVVESRKEIVSPHILLLSENGRPKSILVGRLENGHVPITVGYKTLFQVPARFLTLIYGGFLGEKSPGTTRALYRQISASLAAGEADVAQASLLEVNSDLYRLVQKSPVYTRDPFPKRYLHWKMNLPADISKFFDGMTAKHRYWLKRLPRQLEKDFPGRVRIVLLQGKEGVEELCSSAEMIARLTYQRGLGVGFIRNAEHERRMELCAERGWLRAYILYVGDRPCAFWIGTLYDGVFHLDYTGYDPAYRKYEPGTILFIRMVEGLCGEKIKTMDFGFGDAFYKERFGDEKWEEASVFLYASSLKGLRLFVCRTGADVLTHIAERILRNLKITAKVKKMWRDRLRSPARSREADPSQAGEITR